MKGEIKDYKFSLTAKSYVEGITVEEVNSLFNTLFKLAIPLVNAILREGIALPPLKPFFDLSKSELTMLNHYIRIDFVPIPCKEGFEQLVDLIFHKLIESYRKVKITRQAQKNNIPNWLKVNY